MTSESMIMTKEGITLASDMAITTPENKSYNCGTKIFKLTDDFPIGIMINGNVDFQNIPLETLIGEFAKTVDFKKIKTVQQIKDQFLNYLSINTNYTTFNDYLISILHNFKKELIEEIKEYGFEETLSYYSEKDASYFINNNENYNTEFYEIIPQDKNKEEVNMRIWRIFSYYFSFEGTGIIFAGFDSDNFYPTFFEITLHCNDNGKIIYEENDSMINSEKPVIKVFAINEEAYTFITGISKNFEDFIKEYIEESNNIFLNELTYRLTTRKYNKTLIDEILKICTTLMSDIYKDIGQQIQNFKINGIYDTSEFAEYLPKQIHWDLANYLIKLTALKQKFSSDNETVSSETEIAFITKHNHFEWIQKD